MDRSRKLFVVLITSLLMLVSPAGLAVWNYDGDNSTFGNVHFSIGDGEQVFAGRGNIFTADRSEPFTSRKLCTSDFEQSCLQIPAENRQLQASLSMPICDGLGLEQICIEGFEVGGSSEAMQKARFVRYLDYDFPPSGGPYNFPESAAQSVWGVQVNGRNLTYLVAVNYNFIFSPSGSWENFGGGVYPVRWVPGNFPKLEYSNDGRLSTEISAWMAADCITGETNGCYKLDYPDSKMHVALDLKTEFSSPLWITGRMANSKMQFEDLPGKLQKVRIQGEEVDVFGSGITLPTERYNQLMNQSLELRPESNRWVGFGGGDTRSFEALRVLGPLMGDQAQGYNRQWGFSGGLINYASSCVSATEGIVGYVTTDAMVYEPGAPSFNGSYFSYRVAGLHLDPGGRPIQGSYEFGISNDLAKCLYGFSGAPVSATVAVIGESGSQDVATTVVSSKDDWVKLNAKGFTFSENKINVTLKQASASQVRTLSNFAGGSVFLSTQQKAEIRAVLSRSTGNTKFICTGIRFVSQPSSENVKVRARAKAACEYAKALRPNLSFWVQTKTTTAKSFNGKVMVVSKG